MFINGKDTALYQFATQRIGDNIFYYFAPLVPVANIPNWTITTDIIHTAAGNGDEDAGARSLIGNERFKAIKVQAPFQITT